MEKEKLWGAKPLVDKVPVMIKHAESIGLYQTVVDAISTREHIELLGLLYRLYISRTHKIYWYDKILQISNQSRSKLLTTITELAELSPPLIIDFTYNDYYYLNTTEYVHTIKDEQMFAFPMPILNDLYISFKSLKVAAYINAFFNLKNTCYSTDEEIMECCGIDSVEELDLCYWQISKYFAMEFNLVGERRFKYAYDNLVDDEVVDDDKEESRGKASVSG